MSDRVSNISARQAVGDEAHPAAAISFEDAALADKCRSGDLRAFESLVAKYQDRVYNLIYRIVGRPAEAEDLAQETFLRALEKIRQFRGASGLYTWLFRIAVNLAISHRRRVGRVHFKPLLAGSELEAGHSGQAEAAVADRNSPPVAANMQNQEVRRRVVEAIEALDEDFRIVVVLRDVEDMDYAQIGRVLDLPAGTVKSRLHRGREMLKTKLADLM